MYKDILSSFIYHIILFILFALVNLFFYKKTDLYQLNVSLVDTESLKSSKYIPLKIRKEDLQYNTQVKKAGEVNTDLKTSIGEGDNLNTKESLILKNNTNDLEKIITSEELTKFAYKDNIVTQNKSADNNELVISNNINKHKNNTFKDTFVDKIISGLDKGSLSQYELMALNDQIKGCWYGQGGYNSNEDLKVELLLTMNPDATINSIEVLNEETYNTPIRKTFLDQVLRALKDPKCKQLRLPKGSYNNWKIIHIIFDPKG